ncbi:MAG: hypothetical protein J2P48_18615 [Alphaproteobacteria bacterium]|nr:hypothetical protein [Alphaproteobacteria bacterium]
MNKKPRLEKIAKNMYFALDARGFPVATIEKGKRGWEVVAKDRPTEFPSSFNRAKSYALSLAHRH